MPRRRKPAPPAKPDALDLLLVEIRRATELELRGRVGKVPSVKAALARMGVV